VKLDIPFLQLPVSFDAAALASEIEALGESAWRPHPLGYPGNDALALVSVDGDPASDAVRGPMRPTPYLLRCPYLLQTLHAIGAVWGRSRLMRLSGQAEVTPHVDVNYYWREHMRVHVPIVTQPSVRFYCGDADIHMAAGECWIFDTWRLHRVLNDADRPRIHLVADTVGGNGFWQLLRRARPYDRSSPQWQPERFQPLAGPAALPDFETSNLPVVMTPWEIRDHLVFLIEEGVPGAEMDAFAQLVTQFIRLWHALWAKYGESHAGWPDYSQLRGDFEKNLARFEPLVLRNGIPLVNAVRAIVLKCLLSEQVSGPDIEQRDRPRS
jgi:hypothetical protein